MLSFDNNHFGLNDSSAFSVIVLEVRDMPSRPAGRNKQIRMWHNAVPCPAALSLWRLMARIPGRLHTWHSYSAFLKSSSTHPASNAHAAIVMFASKNACDHGRHGKYRFFHFHGTTRGI